MTATKVKDLTLFDWQVLLEDFKRRCWRAKPMAAMRIDNTPLSTARHFGGFGYNGDHYTVFYFTGGALLGVRDDFLRWATKKVKDNAKASDNINSPTAGRAGSAETAEATHGNPTAQGVSR